MIITPKEMEILKRALHSYIETTDITTMTNSELHELISLYERIVKGCKNDK